MHKDVEGRMMPEPTTPEQKIRAEAIKYARENKKDIASKYTDLKKFQNEEHPVSVFMAGSPGAGKTEASVALLEKFSGEPIIRIDPDELRFLFPGYLGGNAFLFQPAVSILVDHIHDRVLKQSQTFLLDGTLANYDIARENIDRSIKKGRTVQILYVYQDPLLAWKFVQEREAAEGRRIRREDFIDQYFAAREVVNCLKRELGRQIKVDLLMKNMDNTYRWYKAGVDRIDNHIPEKYSRADLERVLPPLSE